jgi:hypothetical protein
VGAECEATCCEEADAIEWKPATPNAPTQTAAWAPCPSVKCPKGSVHRRFLAEEADGEQLRHGASGEFLVLCASGPDCEAKCCMKEKSEQQQQQQQQQQGGSGSGSGSSSKPPTTCGEFFTVDPKFLHLPDVCNCPTEHCGEPRGDWLCGEGLVPIPASASHACGGVEECAKKCCHKKPAHGQQQTQHHQQQQQARHSQR